MPPFVPGPDATCSTAGGLPAVACPTPEPVTYEFPVLAGWNLPEIIGDFPAPVLLVGADLADVTPEPRYPLDVEIAWSVPVGDPTVTPADNAWQVALVSSATEPGPVALGIPLDYTPPAILAGDPIWFRIRIVDSVGCESRFLAFFSEGVPSTWDHQEPVPVAMSVGRDRTVVHDLLIEAAPAADQPGPTASAMVEVAPECPPARLAVAVAPGCEFPVQIDQTVEVTVETSEEAPLFVAEARPVAEVVSIQVSDDAGQPGETEAIAAGWAQIVVSGYGPPASVARLLLGGAEILIPRNEANPDALIGPYVLDAPAGLLGPAGSVQVWTDDAPNEIGLNVAVLYPPS